MNVNQKNSVIVMVLLIEKVFVLNMYCLHKQVFPMCLQPANTVGLFFSLNWTQVSGEIPHHKAWKHVMTYSVCSVGLHTAAALFYLDIPHKKSIELCSVGCTPTAFEDEIFSGVFSGQERGQSLGLFTCINSRSWCFYFGVFTLNRCS